MRNKDNVNRHFLIKKTQTLVVTLIIVNDLSMIYYAPVSLRIKSRLRDVLLSKQFIDVIFQLIS